MSEQFYFKQFSLEWVQSLNIKTVLFQAIQFSISRQFSSIWPIDRTLSGDIYRTLVVGGASYPSAKMQSMYSTAPTDRAMQYGKNQTL